MPTYDLNQQYLDTERALPGKHSDGDLAPARGSRFGEQFVRTVGRASFAEEGSYFSATNPTPGTGITMQASVTAYAATTPSLIVTNLATAAEGKSLVMDYVRILVATVPGGSGLQRYDMRIDSGLRYASAGSTLTPKNVNMDSSASTLSRCYVGAIVAAAATANERIVAFGNARNGVGLAGDVYQFDFSGLQSAGNYLNPATTVGLTTTIPVPPVVLGPQHSFLLNWMARSAQPAFMC